MELLTVVRKANPKKISKKKKKKSRSKKKRNKPKPKEKKTIKNMRKL
jgi:hypothetical protein